MSPSSESGRRGPGAGETHPPRSSAADDPSNTVAASHVPADHRHYGRSMLPSHSSPISGESHAEFQDHRTPSTKASDEQISTILIRLSNVERQLDMFKRVPGTGDTGTDQAMMRSLLVPGTQGPPQIAYTPSYHAQVQRTTPVFDDHFHQPQGDIMESLSLRRDLTRPENPPYGMWWSYTVEETLLWPILGYQGSVNLSLDAIIDSESSDEEEQDDELRGARDLDGSSPPKRRRGVMFAADAVVIGLDDGATVHEFIDDFLRRVHIKSPILDPAELQSHALEMVENGLDWSERTCRVLLACALGAICQPWDPAKLERHDGREPSPRRRTMAQRYFRASQKRLGKLCTRTSVLAAQCLFLAGTYLMCAQKPVASLRMFNMASMACRAHIFKRRARESRGLPSPSRSHATEQRLCWACFTAERELACEFGMETSGLNVLAYATSLPTPFDGPERGSSSSQPAPPPPPPPATMTEPHEDRSWYFFLTDIMLRKLEMRIDIFMQEKRREAYRRAAAAQHQQPDGEREEEQAFFRGLVDALREFESQAAQYHATLPPALQFPLDDDDPPLLPDELRQHLRWRLRSLRHDICAPALYILAHNDVSSWPPRLVHDLVLLANGCLRLDAAALDACLAAAHRHRWTWLELRKAVRSGLLLVAARRLRARCPEQLAAALEVPSDGACRRGAARLARVLEHWAPEATDCATLLRILRDLDPDYRVA